MRNTPKAQGTSKLAKKENIQKRKKKRRGGNFGEWTHQNAILMP